MPHDKDLLAPSSFAVNQSARLFRDGSFAIASMAAICMFSYILFTAILLDSQPIDRAAGMMFCANILPIVCLAAFALLSKRIARFCALSAAGIQTIIAVALLIMTHFYQTLEILCINGPIVLLLLAIGFWISHSDHKPSIANFHGSNVG
jgi:hypothetical protein